MNIKKLYKKKNNMTTSLCTVSSFPQVKDLPGKLTSPSFIPTVSWYQTTKNVYLEILLSDSKNVIVDYETDPEKGESSTLLFEADANQKHYRLCVELFDTIVDDDSTHMRMDNKVKVMLRKKEEKEWSRIPKVKDQYKQAFKVDWSKMEDDEPEEDSDMKRMMEEMKLRQMMSSDRMAGLDPSIFKQMGESNQMGDIDFSKLQKIDNSEEMGSDDEEEIDTSNFSEEDHIKMKEMAEQVRGEDGEIDMTKFEEVMKGMKMEDFEGLMNKLTPEQLGDMIGEEGEVEEESS